MILAFSLAFAGVLGVIWAFIVVSGALVFTIRRPWSPDSRYRRWLDEAEKELVDGEYICRKLELAVWNVGKEDPS